MTPCGHATASHPSERPNHFANILFTLSFLSLNALRTLFKMSSIEPLTLIFNFLASFLMSLVLLSYNSSNNRSWDMSRPSATLACLFCGEPFCVHCSQYSLRYKTVHKCKVPSDEFSVEGLTWRNSYLLNLCLEYLLLHFAKSFHSW